MPKITHKTPSRPHPYGRGPRRTLFKRPKVRIQKNQQFADQLGAWAYNRIPKREKTETQMFWSDPITITPTADEVTQQGSASY